MGIVEKIQEKSRAEYVALARFWLARLSGMIQQKPLQAVAIAIAVGMFLVLFSRLAFSLLLLAVCIAGVVYFIAPETKIR